MEADPTPTTAAMGPSMQGESDGLWPVLSSTFDRIPIPILVTRLQDGVYLAANDAFLAVSGYTRNEIIGHPSTEVARWRDPEDRQRFAEQLRASGSLTGFEGEFLTKSGDVRRAIFSAAVVDRDGQPAAVVFARDITEEVAESERSTHITHWLRAIFDSSFDGVAIHVQGVIVEANDALATIFGYDTAEETIGLNVVQDLAAPEFRDVILQAVRSGAELPYVAEGLRKDGSRVTAELAGRTIEYRGQTARVSFVHDLTDLLAAQDAVRQAEERYRTIVENVPAVTYLWDPNSDAENAAAPFVSPQIERLTGYTVAEWQSSPGLWFRSIHPDDIDAIMATWCADVEARRPFHGVYRMMTKDGRTLWIRDEARPPSPDNPRDGQWQGVMYDITDRMATQQRLTAVSEIHQAILAATSPGDIARDALSHLRTAVGAFRAIALEIDIEADTVSMLAGAATDESFTPDVRTANAADIIDIALLQQGAVRRYDDILQTESRQFQGFRDEGVRSILTLPLIAHGTLIGLLSLMSKDVGAFSEQDERLATEIAGPLGLSLHQARLHEQVERSAAELSESLRDLRRADSARRDLLAQVVNAQEEERRRIASDIHDDSIQKLAAISLRLQTLRAHITDEGGTATLEKIEETVVTAIGRLRHLMFELIPPSLDRHGLGAALRAELDQTKAASGLDYELEDDLEQDLDVEVRTVAYRIAQEAIGNVRKHAAATKVSVRIVDHEGGALLQIRDDGLGISPDPESPTGHLGVTAMRERAQMAGGWLKVGPHNLGGTLVECWLPGAGQRNAPPPT